MKQKFVHLLLTVFIPIASFGYQVLSHISTMFSVRIPYNQLLSILSFFTLSCGLLNLLGSEPYTVQLIIVGMVGLFLSVAVSLFRLVKIGFVLLCIFAKEERSH